METTRPLTPSSYRIRRPEVVSEHFEGEAVIVNLRLGRYYALSPLASALWERLELSPSLPALVSAAGEVWSDATVAERELRGFLERLLGEELVEPLADPGSTVVEPLPGGIEPLLDFEVFNDLEELLVLDPIHDLDDDGWPTVPGSPRSDLPS